MARDWMVAISRKICLPAVGDIACFALFCSAVRMLLPWELRGIVLSMITVKI